MHYKDVKKIIKIDDLGEAPLNPIERELADMVVRYRRKIGELADKRAQMFDAMYSIFSFMLHSEWGKDLMKREIGLSVEGLKDDD